MSLPGKGNHPYIPLVQSVTIAPLFFDDSRIMPLTDHSIAFIGAGNMASALVKGLIATGLPGSNILLSDKQSGRAGELARECGARTGTNTELAQAADVIVLAVKPQGMQAVVEEIAPVLARRDCLLMSIAAGVTLTSLATWTRPEQAIV